jgi:Carboxypeptidase regulatory-like domain
VFHPKLAVFGLAFLFSVLSSGQTFRGGISGTVVDQSGGAIADTQVKLVGTDTGLTRVDHTSSAGEFTFQDLPLGKYSITVSQAGFQTVDVHDINVEAGRVYDLPIKLPVATQATSVEVAASAIQIETSTSALTSVIPTKAIEDIPLNGRDFTQLLKVNPGVNAVGSVNGTRTNAINWQIDGADNNDLWHNSAAVNQGGVSGVAGTLLPIDAIDEFSLQTSSNAEQGRNAGGVLNLVIKSGTNNFHGSLYYFNRNEFFAARDWFTPPSAPTAELRNNQEGGSLGGPIWRNHTFFFLTYEQQNFTAGNTAQGTTPSAAWVSLGEQTLAHYGVPVNPVSLNLINALWPANSLTGPATQDNFFSTANGIYNSYNGIVKLDHIFNETNNIAVRWFGGTGTQTAYVGSVVPYYYQVAPSRMHNFSFVYNHVFSPRFVSQTLAGVNYFKQVFVDANSSANIPALGLNTGVTNPSLFGSPDITIRGFDEIGLTPPFGRIDTTGHIDETLTYTTGTHQFRFGGEYRRARLDVYYERNARGVFVFDGSQGPVDPANGQVWGTSNASLASLADFLAGYVATNNAHITSGNLQRNYYLNGGMAFFQDTWKATPNLTFNYGLNWVFQSPISSPGNRISTFIPADGGITYVGTHGLSTLWPRDYHDFAPRFGFAYQPRGMSKLVVRGGWGIYYQVPNVNYFGDNHTSNGGATGINDNPPVYNLSNQAPLAIQYGVPVFGSTTAPPPPYGAFSASQHFVTGYALNSNLNVQYQLNQNSVLEVGYTGSLSRHLPVTLDINQIPIGAPEVNSSRPYASQFPNLGAINEVQSVGNGYYNGMLVSLRSSNFHGFGMKLNYTYGHARDDDSFNRGIVPQNSYCLRCDYGNSDYDVRHSFVTFLTYSMPTPSRWKTLLGGWQLNSLLTFYTGQPFTVFSGEDTSLTGENADRAEVVGNAFQNVPASVKGSYAYWFNPAAFALPATGTYANQPRNEFYGPPTYQVDFSVFKNTNLTEHIKTQLRMEIFNIFNTRDLAPPYGGLGAPVGSTNVVSSSGLGQITQTLDVFNGAPGIGTGAPRNVQLALKIIF